VFQSRSNSFSHSSRLTALPSFAPASLNAGVQCRQPAVRRELENVEMVGLLRERGGLNSGGARAAQSYPLAGEIDASLRPHARLRAEAKAPDVAE
jgi:hypothetical protein